MNKEPDALLSRIVFWTDDLRRTNERIEAIHRDMTFRNPDAPEYKELLKHWVVVNNRIFELKNAWFG